MSIVYSWHQGTSPLLISIPHDGWRIPPRMSERMTEQGAAMPDTDWHVRRLYDFAKIAGASIIAAKYSRYVIDLNRSPQDEVLYEGRFTTGLVPLQTFAGRDIYKDGWAPGRRAVARRIERYWRPYHAELAHRLERVRGHFGYAVLWDAHSIRSSLPLLFEGELPVLNIGTNDGKSCPPEVEEAVARAAAGSPYSHVTNGRFRGGYITRHYGDPAAGTYAVQLELAQHAYMNEDTARYNVARAGALSDTLGHLLRACLDGASRAATAAGLAAARS